MRPSTRVLPWLFVVVTCLILAPRAQAEWSHDHTAPKRVFPTLNTLQEFISAAVPDGSGGAYVLESDARTGVFRLYVAHLLANGEQDPAWPVNGVQIYNLAFTPFNGAMVSDGQGGLWVNWVDQRSGPLVTRFTRVLANGSIAPGFPADGATPVLSYPSTVTPNHQRVALAVGPTGTLYAVWQYAGGATSTDLAGCALTTGGAFTWAALMATTAADERNMDIALDSAPGSDALDVVYLSGSAAVFRQFSRTTGAPLAGEVNLSPAADFNARPQICTDALGGMLVAHQDTNVGLSVVMTRLRNGSISESGVSVSTSGVGGLVISDLIHTGGGNVWLAYAWSASSAVYVQRFTRSSNFAAYPVGTSWASPGVRVVGDGQGGALVLFQEPDGVVSRLAASRLGANGFPIGITVSAPVMSTPGSATIGAACSDGNGGMLVFGYDPGTLPSTMLRMKFDRWGALDGAPVLTSVRDVANDQGGFVRVAWQASYLDRDVDGVVSSYRVWRQVPVAAVAARSAQRSLAIDDGAQAELPLGTVRFEPIDATAATAAFAWELVATQAAATLPQYSLTVATTGDSSSASTNNIVFMVEARASSFGWTSPPDSGHSVDNIAPATPSSFAGAVVGANTLLTWNANTEPDVAGYEVYRGEKATFDPDPSNLVGLTALTNFLDLSAGQYYKLAAIDTHGNRSGYALLTPTGVLDAGDTAPRELSFTLASANPAVGGASLRYALPSACRVRVQLLDVNGRMVRTLLDASMAAGTYTARWDGRDATGARSAAGMYFARLTAGERTITRRIVLAE